MQSKIDYTPQDGDIITGPFSNDGSPHSAVILRIIGIDVYMFPISSRTASFEKFSKVDSSAVIELNDEERCAVFGNRASKKDLSFIYCGDSNLIEQNIYSLKAMVYNRTAEFVCKASEELISRIAFGVYSSRTLSQRKKNCILGIRAN